MGTIRAVRAVHGRASSYQECQPILIGIKGISKNCLRVSCRPLQENPIYVERLETVGPFQS